MVGRQAAKVFTLIAINRTLILFLTLSLRVIIYVTVEIKIILSTVLQDAQKSLQCF